MADFSDTGNMDAQDIGHVRRCSSTAGHQKQMLSGTPSASAPRMVKAYLWITMSADTRLNNQCDSLVLATCLNGYVRGSEHQSPGSLCSGSFERL